MMALASGYMAATRHPWPCLLFLLPLLVGYEAGVLSLGGNNPEVVRNGADHWIRCALGMIGLRFFWIPPTVLALVFVILTVAKWKDGPGDLIGALSGMLLESVVFALGLWAVSRVLGPLMSKAGVELDTTEAGLRQVITYLGAGIYEEAIFRLALFSLLAGVLRWIELPYSLAIGLAAIASAILFSTAHHIGPYGQEYSNFLFVFRLVAGLYFALLFELRGFGIAVGTHACYNVMVSIPGHTG